ncbi:hypothetical protein [Streptomyces sp. CCM_MD2014]|uniref:hypothetical protein n=1 Tax=Streptomyces sp. CCM_MD2014 TaxID=1561022 RepID=UPI00052AC263|nr:hypothetical protein [Streptomyces sp. CCM_MD2014]AIV35548.1 hypothetical protein NI25_20260 [Streptomyces sp. CCM_MD2014]
MNPWLDLVFRVAMVVAFLGLVLSVCLGRRMTSRPEHIPAECATCSSFRHPSRWAARRALSVIPRQTRGGER